MKTIVSLFNFITLPWVPLLYLLLSKHPPEDIWTVYRSLQFRRFIATSRTQLRNVFVAQCVPPHCAICSAERAIRTFKNHFIATLCTVDKDFPLQLWDTLLPQAELCLNLLRGSRLDPRISAWEQLHGKYNFDAHPLAPLGIRVVMHEKPSQRGSWAPHGVVGFYLGPALQHYRCYRGWVVKTQRERVVDTVAWHPQAIVKSC